MQQWQISHICLLQWVTSLLILSQAVLHIPTEMSAHVLSTMDLEMTLSYLKETPGSVANQEQVFLDDRSPVFARGGQVRVKGGLPSELQCSLFCQLQAGVFWILFWASGTTRQPPSKQRLPWHFTHGPNPSLPRGVRAPNAYSMKMPAKSNERAALWGHISSDSLHSPAPFLRHPPGKNSNARECKMNMEVAVFPPLRGHFKCPCILYQIKNKTQATWLVVFPGLSWYQTTNQWRMPLVLLLTTDTNYYVIGEALVLILSKGIH